MSIWRRPVTLGGFAEKHEATLPGLLGIEVVEVGPDFLRAEMPVDRRHIQPFGILHGGGSVVLAETIGSFAGAMALPEGETCVGVEVNANHLAPVREGDRVSALCRPLQLGRSLQVWQIEITRSDGRLSCVARLTTAVRRAGGAEGVAEPPATR
ncbi:hotdog fold thioesterase [Belnapia sp. T6]|uniref:Hotdog fold thioesterase n=1 Tax=Belnapia mucosa TaxID=2804532 RepID=A0ABS1VCB2_9PROT|nr:hotdog fold thioesterase [Belnapia mucosa]MBL6459326.1 hotdog fold thioesterase [Belnapia mucosa]